MDLSTLPTFENSNLMSKAAAKQASGRLRSKQASAILAALAEAKEEGLTAEQIQDCTSISGNSARPRLIGLERMRLILRSGFRPTKSGRMAWIYKIA